MRMYIDIKVMHALVGGRQAANGAVWVHSVGGRRWLWCIVVALHDPEPECNVSAVQYRGLPNLHAPATCPISLYDKVHGWLLQVMGVSLCPNVLQNPVSWFAWQHFLNRFPFPPKGVELLVCDLLLTLRTSIWQRGGSSNGEPGPAPGSQLAGFQRDLSALRKVTQCYRQAQHKVHTQMWSWDIYSIYCICTVYIYQLLSKPFEKHTYSFGSYLISLRKSN